MLNIVNNHLLQKDIHSAKFSHRGCCFQSLIHPHVALLREITGENFEEYIFDDSDDESYLKSLDPKNWKDQDHYAVLGLRKKRFNATPDDIRKAYRRKILDHHPDKRRSKGEQVADEKHDYFSCITIAVAVARSISLFRTTLKNSLWSNQSSSPIHKTCSFLSEPTKVL
ncbi:unnamed protein product [Trichobilharzia regenti]|nr:unnamed protein product [Trichobilharzia regenti]